MLLILSKEEKSHLNRQRRRNGNIKYILDQLERAWSLPLLEEVVIYFNKGYEVEEIAKTIDRCEWEVFLAIIDQFIEGNIEGPFAYRKKGETKHVEETISRSTKRS